MNHHPDQRHRKSQQTGVHRHICPIFYRQSFGTREHITQRKGIGRTAKAHDLSVGSTHNRDHYKYKNQFSAHRSNDGLHSRRHMGRAQLHDPLWSHQARDTHKVAYINQSDHHRRHSQSQGHIPLGIFQIGLDKGGHVPAVIGKGQRPNGRQDRGTSGDRLGLQSAHRVAPSQSADGNEKQRHQLDKCGSVLEIAAALFGPGVKGETEHDPHRSDGTLAQKRG